MVSANTLETKWLKAVAVHLGSRLGNDPHYAETARTMGSILPPNGFKDVYYGDGLAGTMGIIAQSAIAAGADVYGVSLDFFHKAQGIQLPGAKPSVVMPTMHARMEHMRNNAQSNILMPGSYGTMEEGLEWVCSENGHIKPQVICNSRGYWNGLLEFMDTTINAGFEDASMRQRFMAASSPENVIEKLHELNAQPYMTDPGRIKIAPPSKHYVNETKHTLIVRPAPLDIIGAVMTRVVTYDVSNIPGQNVFQGDVIKPIILVNENGHFNGLRTQLNKIFDTGFSPPERRAFFHVVASESEASELADALDAAPPLSPSFLKQKHAEADRVTTLPSALFI